MIEGDHRGGSGSPLLVHLLRGVIGVSCGLAAIRVGQSGGGALGAVTSLGLVLAALVAFRGCPMCWTIGSSNG